MYSNSVGISLVGIIQDLALTISFNRAISREKVVVVIIDPNLSHELVGIIAK